MLVYPLPWLWIDSPKYSQGVIDSESSMVANTFHYFWWQYFVTTHALAHLFYLPLGKQSQFIVFNELKVVDTIMDTMSEAEKVWCNDLKNAWNL